MTTTEVRFLSRTVNHQWTFRYQPTEKRSLPVPREPLYKSPEIRESRWRSLRRGKKKFVIEGNSKTSPRNSNQTERVGSVLMSLVEEIQGRSRTVKNQFVNDFSTGKRNKELRNNPLTVTTSSIPTLWWKKRFQSIDVSLVFRRLQEKWRGKKHD